MMKKLFVVVFLILICTPYIARTVLDSHLDHNNYENRVLADRPTLSLSELSSFPEQYESYINDHLPFKNEMVRANNYIDVKMFHTSSSERVILGQDNWLFYNDVGDGDPISQYKGLSLLTEEQLQIIANNVELTKNNLAEEGRDFVVFIAPNKERIYFDNLPEYYGKPASNYPVLQIVDYLREHTDVKIVYPYEELMKEKERLQDDVTLYYKTDTHWNELGGYIGVRELLKEIGIQLPSLEAVEDEIEISKAMPGDLSSFLNAGDLIDPGDAYLIQRYKNQPGLSGDDSIYEDANKEKKVIIRRDSFGEAMARYIGSQFNRCRILHRRVFDNDYIREEDADIFILEMVERYVPDTLLNYRYNKNVISVNADQYTKADAESGYKYYIENIDYQDDNTPETIDYIRVSGWLLHEGIDSSNSDIRIVLKSTETGEYIEIPTTMVNRPDVTKYFKDKYASTNNYDNSGFNAKVLRRSIDIDNDNFEIYALYNGNGDEMCLINLNHLLK